VEITIGPGDFLFNIAAEAILDDIDASDMVGSGREALLDRISMSSCCCCCCASLLFGGAEE